MIGDLTEKVWLHYRGTFDKMLDLLLVGSGPSTQETLTFDKGILKTPISTYRLHNGELQLLLNLDSSAPRHRAENIITGSGEVTVSNAIHNLFFELLTSDDQELLTELDVNFYILDKDSQNSRNVR
jgi:hypothetical protein